jgi:Flp pilus assembly protein TadB
VSYGSLVILEAVYLLPAAIWTGAMTYSLSVVQPRTARFFTVDEQREEFLTTLAHGNRWRVLAMAATLIASAAAIMLRQPWPGARVVYGVALVLDVAATTVFVYVSWRHWPARVFALSEELPAFRRRLLICARTIWLCVGFGFVLTLVAGVGHGR